MSKTVNISVLMTVYNEERHIREAIDSVLGQTFTDFELLVLDDGSSDGTLEILRQAEQEDPRIRVYPQGRVGKRPKLLNTAIELSRGAYLAILDADDVTLPNRLERQHNKLSSNANLGVVGTSAILIDQSGKQIGMKWTSESDSELRSLLFRQFPFIHSSMMMRRDIVTSVGGYDGRYPYCHDYDLLFRIARVAQLAGIREPQVAKRTSGFFASRVSQWSKTREVIDCRRENWREQGRLRDYPYVMIVPTGKYAYKVLRNR